MRIVLASNAVAYDLYAKCVAVDPNIGRSCRGLQIQFPDSSTEAANAGGILRVGRPNAGATDVDAELKLNEGDSDNYPQDIKNTISLVGRSVTASVNNAVAYVMPLFA
jgi:hypothetical protein